MAVDWRGALAYPIAGPERERPLVATWVLLLVATVVPLLPAVAWLGLLVPVLAIVLATGYLVRVLAASQRGDPAPPVLADGWALLRDGLAGLLIGVAYLAIPVALLAGTVYGAIWSGRVAEPDAFSTLTIYAGSTAVLVLSGLGAYLLPIALASYARGPSLPAAVSRRDLSGAATHGAYFAGWTAGVGLLGTGAGVAVGVGSIHRVGPVLATALLAYVAVVTVHVWGRALARVR